MSSINIERAVKNIRSTITVFTRIVEAVVNSIQAIELTKRTDGHIVVSMKRSPQQEIDAESRVVDVAVSDNGVGFTKANRDSFDTPYSAQKLAIGGKGFGRFTCPLWSRGVPGLGRAFSPRRQVRAISPLCGLLQIEYVHIGTKWVHCCTFTQLTAKAPMATNADKDVHLKIVVNGKPVPLKADPNDQLGGLVEPALDKAKVADKSNLDKWIFTNAAGKVLEKTALIASFGFQQNEELSLSMGAGVVG